MVALGFYYKPSVCIPVLRRWLFISNFPCCCGKEPDNETEGVVYFGLWLKKDQAIMARKAQSLGQLLHGDQERGCDLFPCWWIRKLSPELPTSRCFLNNFLLLLSHSPTVIQSPQGEQPPGVQASKHVSFGRELHSIIRFCPCAQQAQDHHTCKIHLGQLQYFSVLAPFRTDSTLSISPKPHLRLR